MKFLIILLFSTITCVEELSASVLVKWSFEGNLQDSAESGGTADHLTATARLGPLNPVYVAGVVGQAIQVGRAAGDATVLVAGDSNDLDLGPEFTVESYVYRTTESGTEWERFATKWFDGSSDWHWSFRAPPGRSQDLFMNGVQQINQGNVSADLSIGEWHHVAITGDPVQGLRIWQDGVVVGTAAYVLPANGTSSFRIGNATANSGEGSLQFTGWVDEFQIHDVSQDVTYMTGRTALISGAPAITSFTASPSIVSSGTSSTLSWVVSNADTLTLNGGSFVNSDVTGQTSAIGANLTQSTTYTLTASNAMNSSTVAVNVAVAAAGDGLVISEFLAINDGGLKDENNEASDWIEIHNPHANAVEMDGWYLTDSASDLTKWRLPAGTVPALGYVVVFASGKNRTGGELHTNFKLSGTGEYLALVRPDGATIATEFAPMFPNQQANVSYGFQGDSTSPSALDPPTPGAANAISVGPVIMNLTENPLPVPGDHDPIVVSAEIFPSPSPILSATLHYRVMFGAEIALPMSNTSGNLYSAVIPATASLPNDMVRWYVTAQSADGSKRAPLFLSPLNSPQYFGTVIADPSNSSQLPVMQRFVENPAATETTAGTRGAFFYAGEFFDNIFTRIRGGSSVSWPKKSYKIDFNDGYHFRFRAGVPRVEEINLNSTYTDKSYMRAVLSYEHQRDVGMPSPEAFLIQLRQNGQFWNVAICVEQPDRDYLQRWGFDPDGAMYKGANSPTHYEPSSPLSLWEKKTRLQEDKSDLSSFITGLAFTGTALDSYLFDHVNLPVQINYMATTAILQDIDGSDKNHYLYRDTNHSGEWCMLPWDLDLTFGPNALNTDSIVAAEAYTSHPYIGARPFMLHANKYNHFLEAIIANPRTKAMLNRRIRSLCDQHLASGYFENRIDELVSELGPDVLLDKAKWGSNAAFPGEVYTLLAASNRIKNEYLAPRAAYLTVAQAEGQPAAVGIPASQDLLPTLAFGSIDNNPVSGNQEEEFIELVNSNAYDLDVSGWTLGGGVSHALKSGTVIPAGESLYLSPNVAAFRNRSSGPHGGMGLFVQGDYSGNLNNFGELLLVKNAAGVTIAQTTTTVNPSDAQLYLVISEIMYHPADSPDAEYIELQNISPSVTLDLTGVKFTAGVSFDFTASNVTSLPPGGRVLVVKNQVAFQAKYGLGLPVAGEFADLTSLNNGGERLALDDVRNNSIKKFTYGNAWPWPTDANGLGRSLVLVSPLSNPDPALPMSWRASIRSGGNPGVSDASTFAGEIGADHNGNGIDDLIDYATGHVDGAQDVLPAVTRSGATVTVSYRKNLAADDVVITAQWSDDLLVWHELGSHFAMISRSTEGESREMISYQSNPATFPLSNRRFFRLSAAK